MTAEKTQLAQLLAALQHPGPLALCRKNLDDRKFRPSVATAERAVALERKFRTSADIWFGLNVVHADVRRGHRGDAIDVRRLVGLTADLDIKDGGLTSWEACEAVISGLTEVMAVQPVAVINSGHGLQPIWAIARDDPQASWPDHLDPRWAAAKRLTERWGDVVRTEAAKQGGSVDAVFDLARILRAPGTVNLKFPDVPVPTSVRFAAERKTLTVETATERVERALAVLIPTASDKPSLRSDQAVAGGRLQELVEQLESTTTERNNLLNHLAFQTALAGKHSKQEAKTALVAAAQKAGLDEDEATRTFESGWRAGVRNRGNARSQESDESETSRLSRNSLRDTVWKSDLCTDHKMVMLAICKHMNDEDLAWPSRETLAKHASMSTTRLGTLLRGLCAAGWLEKGKASWVRSKGRKSNSYRPPTSGVVQTVPPHCSRLDSRAGNLRRTPNLDAIAKRRAGTGPFAWTRTSPSLPPPYLDRSSSSDDECEVGLKEDTPTSGDG